MNTNQYGKDVSINALGWVYVEVWRQGAPFRLSIGSKTLGTFFGSTERNLKKAHAWADARIALAQQYETQVLNDLDERMERMGLKP